MTETIIRSEYFTRDGVPYIRVVYDGVGFEMPLSEFLTADLPDLIDKFRDTLGHSKPSSNTT